VNIERALATHGFMLESELTYIAECAAKSKCIAEVGCYMGRSGRAWSDNTSGVVFCVDTWRDGGEPNFDQNLADCQNVCKVQMDSRRAAKFFQLAGVTFDCIFLDADHDYENIHADIMAWKPLLREGGILAGHDYQPPFPGVIQAVKELVPNFSLIGGSIWTNEPNPNNGRKPE
jgi:predicted O-methyltransferase YrrM